MARFVPENRKLAIILGASIAVHGVIAVMALLGDPIVERPVLAATSGRIFIPDDVEAQLVIDPTTMPEVAKPAPIAPAPAPAPPSPVVQPPAPAHHAQRHAQLATPDPKHMVDGLFADHDSLAVNQRKPSADLQQQIDEAHRHAGAATIGNSTDLRDPTDTTPRLGTGVPCACDPPRTGEPAYTPPPPDRLPPPVVRVHPPTLATTLTPDELLRIIQSTYMAGRERCQRELARKTGDASGKVDLELTIDEGGATAGAAADGVDDGLDRCIEARAGGWRFPAPHDVKTGAAISARYRVSLALQAK